MLELLGQLLINGVQATSVYVLVALGFGVIYNTTHEFHIAHAGGYLIASYTGYLLFTHILGSFVIKLLITLLGSFLVLALYGFLMNKAYSLMRNSGVSILQRFIFSLGILTIITSAYELFFGSYSLTWGIRDIPIKISYFVVSFNYLILLIITIIIGILLIIFFKKNKIGYQLKAVSNDANFSKIIGIKISKIYNLSYIIGSMLLVPSAVIQGIEIGSDPYQGLHTTLVGILSTLMSNGKYTNIIFFVCFFIIVDNVVQLFLPTQWSWSFVVSFALFIIFLQSYTFYHSKVK
jgi:branched-chain amino acid transport system permease protein